MSKSGPLAPDKSGPLAPDKFFGRKVARLPASGVLLFATDLQGNYGDYEAMKRLYFAEQAAGHAPTLAFCGDLVHGPSPDVLADWPDYLGTAYPDESARLVLDFQQFVREERVLSVLGNHEHAHIGGPRVPKFYPDEAAVLDAALGDKQPEVHAFLRTFPLIAVAPCGVVLTHGAPGGTEPTLEAFEALDYAGYEHVSINAMYAHDTVGALLWCRGASDDQALALLRATQGRPAGVVAFGHDVVREGYDTHGDHQICVSTSYGCFDQAKTYLRLDLGARYDSVADLRPGIEICPLYPDAVGLGVT